MPVLMKDRLPTPAGHLHSLCASSELRCRPNATQVLARTRNSAGAPHVGARLGSIGYDKLGEYSFRYQYTPGGAHLGPDVFELVIDGPTPWPRPTPLKTPS